MNQGRTAPRDRGANGVSPNRVLEVHKTRRQVDVVETLGYGSIRFYAGKYVSALICQDDCGACAFEIRHKLSDDRCRCPRQSPGIIDVGAIRDDQPLGPQASQRGTLPGSCDLVPDVRALTRGLAETIDHPLEVSDA
jgi:hypothetical protein